MLRYILALATAVFGCGWVALFYRPINTYLNSWLLSWLGDDFLQLRHSIQAVIPLSDMAIYTIPGALWVFGLSLLGWRLRITFRQHKLHLFYLSPIIGLGFELIQFMEWSDGTFDPLDALWVSIGFGLAFFICHRVLPGHWREQPGRWRYVLFFLVLFAAFGVDVWA